MNDDSMFIPVYHIPEELGEQIAINEAFLEDPCCEGHALVARNLNQLYGRMLQEKQKTSLSELQHLADSWDAPVNETDMEL